MTRINVIPVKELTDQHLIAEYREIFMIGSALQKSLSSPNWDKNRIPKVLTLGTGHVMFFYDKGRYLYKRYLKIRDQMLMRGFSPAPDRGFKVEQWPVEYYKDWTPTPRDEQVIRTRIEERIKQKPNWYRQNGKPLL